MGLDRMVELITISVDTPFAQKRFAEEAKISNVTFLSDYRAADFRQGARATASGPPSAEPGRVGGGQGQQGSLFQITPSWHNCRTSKKPFDLRGSWSRPAEVTGGDTPHSHRGIGEVGWANPSADGASGASYHHSECGERPPRAGSRPAVGAHMAHYDPGDRHRPGMCRHL